MADTSQTDHWTKGGSMVLRAAVLFWSLSYALMTARGTLLAEPLPIFSSRRLVSTLAGSLLFAVAAHWLSKQDLRSPTVRYVSVGLTSLAATVCLFGVQVLVERIARWSPPVTSDGQIGWLLIWAGYFAAWLVGTLNHQPSTDISSALPGPVETVAGGLTGEPEGLDTFWVQRNRETVRIPLEQIEWVEAEGNYARIHAGNGGGLIRSSLRSLERKLGPAGFVRVHRSALCRKDLVTAVRREDKGMRLVLRSGAEVAVGRAYAPAVLEELRL